MPPFTGKINEVFSTTQDIPLKQASVLDSYDSEVNGGALYFRGFEAGPGIQLDVVDFDNDVYITPQKKIVISLTGAIPPPPGPSGAITNVISAGTGQSLIYNITSGTLALNSLLGGLGIDITYSSGDITIAVDPDDLPVNAVSAGNPGALSIIQSNPLHGPLVFYDFIAGPGIGLSYTGTSIQITASPLAQNVGTGVGIYKQQSAGYLQFKSLTAGPGISLTASSNEIEISSSATIPSSFVNLGTGIHVFDSIVGNQIQFNTIKAGAGISVGLSGNDIVISNTGSLIQGVNMGTPPDGEPVYLGVESGTNFLMFRRIYGGDGIVVDPAPSGNAVRVSAMRTQVVPAGTDNDGENIAKSTTIENGQTIHTLRRLRSDNTNNLLISSETNSIKFTLADNVPLKNTVNRFSKQQYTALYTLVDASTMVWDLNNSNIAMLSIAGPTTASRTMSAPLNMKDGGKYTLLVKNANGVDIIWDSVFQWVDAVPPVFSNITNSIDICEFISDGTKMYGYFKVSPTSPIVPGLLRRGTSETTISSPTVNATINNFFSYVPYDNASISIYINGKLLRQSGWTISGLNLTLNDGVNGFSVTTNDVVQSVYEYIT